jgi:predicted DCC family thiol-disulfide oxidoreductase YuxK
VSAQPLIVFYDGNCRFCRAGITTARRMARAPGLTCLPFDHPRAVAVLAVLPPDERHAAFHVLDGRRLFSATSGFRQLLLRMPMGRLACALGLYRAYPWIVRHRSRVGRMLPDMPRPPQAPRRPAA